MLADIKNKLNTFLKTGHSRTSNINKSVLYLLLIKAASILVSFILVPLTIHYINPQQYGVWLTIYSLVAWINTFDIGLSNGLRNRVTAVISKNDNNSAVKYISTTYLLLVIIAVILMGLFFTTGTYINWNKALKIPADINYNIWPLIAVTLAFLCAQFILQPINSVLTALHQPFKASLISFAGQLLTLILVLILIYYCSPNLLLLIIVSTGSPVISMLISSIYFFGTSLRVLRPKIDYIDLKNTKSLLNLSGAFFIVQIGALVLYETDNIIITRTLGPADVTVFNIAFKYFSLLTVAFMLIVTPYWSAFTEAYIKHDFEWMDKSVKRLGKFWLIFSAFAVLLYFLADIFYRVWVGNNHIVVPQLMSLTMAVYVMVQNWTVMYSYILNGIGKLRIQLILVIGTGIVNVPLSVILIKHIGMAGTTVANIIVMIFMNLFMTYQCKLIIKNKATGIWDK
jgi:O-antigen/teichoic acid export membrane protein